MGILNNIAKNMVNASNPEHSYDIAVSTDTTDSTTYHHAYAKKGVQKDENAGITVISGKQSILKLLGVLIVLGLLTSLITLIYVSFEGNEYKGKCSNGFANAQT